MGCIEIDESAFPLVRIAFVGVPTDAQFDEYLAFLSKNLDRCAKTGRKCAILFDASRAGLVTASVRQKQAHWMRTHEERSARFCVGYAFVIQSALIRGALTAILWLAPMPAAHHVAASVAEAEAFLRGKLDSAPSRTRVA